MNFSSENEKQTSILDTLLHLTLRDVADYAAFVLCLGTFVFWLIVFGG